MWERSQHRLQKERKAIQRKALRNNKEISGRDLVRLRRVSGSIQKEQYYEHETERSDDDN